MSIFEYPFMQRAFLVGVLLALIIPCVGIVIVLKRLSMIGDALSHTSLAGVAAGLLFNINPVLGATAACVAAAFGIEAIRKKLPRYAEMSIAIILSAGVGLAGVLSGFVRSAASFNSFLFGSIVAISDGELYTVAVVSGIIVLAFLFLYKELFYLALDERAARMSGIPVGIINSVFTVLIAVTVSIAARTVGALIVVWRPPLLLFQPLPKSSGRPAGFIDVSKPLLQINLANGAELICPRLMPRMVHCHHHSLQKRLIRIALINLPANIPFGVKNSPQARIHRLSGSSLLSPAFLVQL